MISGALLPSSSPTFLRGGAAADAPADLGRTGERDERDVGVVDDRVADRAAAAGDDVEVAGGQPALVEQDARERDRRERRLARGLQHDRAAGRDRGRELVRDEVEREVERADRADDADRHAQRERELAFAGRARVHRHDLAGERARRDRRERERRDRALRFDARGLDRLGRLGRDDLRELLDALRRRCARRVSRISARFHAGSGPASSAALAARTASSTCCAPHFGTRPRSSPSYGARTSIHSPVVTDASPMGTDQSAASVMRPMRTTAADVTRRSRPGAWGRASRASRDRRGAGRSRTPR